MIDGTWDEMLAEFRALGGTAENVCLRQGAFGRGLFPIDPSRRVSVRIPETLLLDTAHVRFENGSFRIAPESNLGARERTFIESYESIFSWGGDGRAEMERVFEQGQALPGELRRVLKSEYHCGDWFDDVTEGFVQQKFIGTRCINNGVRTVMMPIVELANHGTGPTISVQNGVSFQGVFAGEVLLRYAPFDAQATFVTWGFAYDAPQAFSIALAGKVGQNVVHIGREMGLLAPANTYWTPALFRDDTAAKLPFLMLGNKQHPRLCKGIFYKIMREAGFSGVEEAFDTMRHANRMHFLNLLAAIEDLDGPMVKTLRRMARFQLQALSYCYGQAN